MPTNYLFDRFQVPPSIVRDNIISTVEATDGWLSRVSVKVPNVNVSQSVKFPTVILKVVQFSPTSVALIPECRIVAKELMAKRISQPLNLAESYLRPTVETLELFRILGITEHTEVNSFVQRLLPALNVSTSGTDVDTALHSHWLTLLKLCHEAISEEISAKVLDVFLNAPFKRHLSVTAANEFSILIHGKYGRIHTHKPSSLRYHFVSYSQLVCKRFAKFTKRGGIWLPSNKRKALSLDRKT